tara:strand:+ start:296 stop:850 length:555 start_codon:yes stop_codon:yes gene_type:complete
MNKTSRIELGTFELDGHTIVSDPCYDTDTWCNGTVDTKEGTWRAYVIKSDEGEWGNRCGVLVAYHIACGPVDWEDFNWAVEKFEVGVDSGQAGIFATNHFKDDSIVEGVERIYEEAPICEDEPWYSICCDRTLSKQGAGIIPYGAVSSSGFGDGGHRCYTLKDHDGIVYAIKIDFGVIGYEDED